MSKAPAGFERTAKALADYDRALPKLQEAYDKAWLELEGARDRVRDVYTKETGAKGAGAMSPETIRSLIGVQT